MSFTPISYSRSSPGGKAVGEDVPMDDNPAYGEFIGCMLTLWIVLLAVIRLI